MSLVYVPHKKKSGGLFGALGGLLSIGGALTGNPALMAAGKGVSTVNDALTGNGSVGGAIGGLQQTLDALGINTGWTNPADGSLVNKGNDDLDDRLKAWNMINKNYNNYNKQNGVVF